MDVKNIRVRLHTLPPGNYRLKLTHTLDARLEHAVQLPVALTSLVDREWRLPFSYRSLRKHEKNKGN